MHHSSGGTLFFISTTFSYILFSPSLSQAQTIASIYQKSDGTIKDYNDDLALQSLLQIRKMCRASMDTFQKLHGPAAQLASESLTSVKTPAPTSSQILPRKRHRGLVAPRQPRKSRKKNVIKASSAVPTGKSSHSLTDAPPNSGQSPLSVLASSAVRLSQDPPSVSTDPPLVSIDRPSVSIDPPSSSVVYLPNNQLTLPVVVGELSSSVLPLPCSCPALPLFHGHLVVFYREWVMNLRDCT